MSPEGDDLLQPAQRRSDPAPAPGGSASSYSTQVRLSLRPEMPATRALAALFTHLLGIIRATEPGLATRRSEVFLHDYRVAVRRSRSALGRFGALLPEDTLQWAKSFFADLGRRTGTARDLDVLLLELPGYTRPLPQRFRQTLSLTATRCKKDAELEYAALRRLFATRAYRDSLKRWQRSIDQLDQTPCEHNIAQAAADAIEEAARRVFEHMGRLGKAKSDKKVHRLRIRCKKLRYALEFSRSLTPGGEIEELITSLKGIQDALGTFNDLVVHRARVQESVRDNPADAELSAATGRLAAELAARQRKTRKRVRRAVARFQLEGPPRLEQVLDRLRRSAVQSTSASISSRR